MDKTIYALGFFDGVHLGHQALLHACRDLAGEHHARAGVVTFLNHPDALVFGTAPGLINTPEDRERLLTRDYAMDSVVTLPFDRALQDTPWVTFLVDLIENQAAAGFVCGEDFRFGRRGKGSADALSGFCRERGLPCAVVPEQLLEGIRVSSTYIRGLIEAGDM
ncbi:MAG: riboflavin biosynthesis protein RibF, partial [Faecousia sp.]